MAAVAQGEPPRQLEKETMERLREDMQRGQMEVEQVGVQACVLGLLGAFCIAHNVGGQRLCELCLDLDELPAGAPHPACQCLGCAER